MEKETKEIKDVKKGIEKIKDLVNSCWNNSSEIPVRLQSLYGYLLDFRKRNTAKELQEKINEIKPKLEALDKAQKEFLEVTKIEDFYR